MMDDLIRGMASQAWLYDAINVFLIEKYDFLLYQKKLGFTPFPQQRFLDRKINDLVYFKPT